MAGYGQECSVEGKGDLAMFAGEEGQIQMPCKYQMSMTKCGPYEISVVPGQAFDSHYRQYTDTLWVAIKRLGTDFYWKGRTSTRKVNNYFDKPEKREPFNVKENGLSQAPFSLRMKTDEESHSVMLTVTDASWKVIFTAYDEEDHVRRANAGVKVICPNAKFTEEGDFPQALCGNDTDSKALKNREKDLSLASSIKTYMHDMLMNDEITQTSATCDAAARIFQRCKADRSKVIKKCHEIVSSDKVTQCLIKSKTDPMATFVHCLRYNCAFIDDLESCDMLQDAMEGCPKVPGVPKKC